MPSPAQRQSLELKVQKYEANLDGVTSYLASRGVTRESAERFRLGFDPDKQRLVIPYLSPAGPWHLKLRCIAEHACNEAGHSKYVYGEPGTQQHLFNAATLLDAERVVLVEGELDAIVAEQIGLHAVAYPGAETWRSNKHWRWCFDSAEEVVVVADGDEPGRKAAAFVAEQLRNAISGEVRTVQMPDGHDTGSFVAEYGELEYLEELEWL